MSTLEEKSPEKAQQIEEVGIAALAEEHEEAKKPLLALKKHPWAVVWCVYAIWVLVLNSFENQAAGSVLGIPQFRKDFGSPYAGDYVLPTNWQSAFLGAPVASTVIGSLGTGIIADKIGRKYSLAIALVISFIAITVEFIAVTNAVFFAGKFISGFAIGAFISIGMTYVGECAPTALRGILTAAAAIAFTFGPLLVAFIIKGTGTYPNRWAYRSVFMAQYGVAAITSILWPFMPESPWWLVSVNKEDAAAQSLRKLGYTPTEVEKQLASMRLTIEAIRHETSGASYLECFRKSNLRRTIISIAPMSITALSGVYFISAYSTYYFQLAGYSTSESFNLQVIQQVLSLAGNICSWFLIDRVGRRNLTFWGLAFLTVQLFITGALASVGTTATIRGSVAFILIYCFFFNLSIGATSYSLVTEVASSRLRVKTVSIGIATQNVIYLVWGFVIPYIFNPDRANLGGKTAFIFGGLAVFCLVYLWFYQPETAGRTYEELDELFAKGVSAREFNSTLTRAAAAAEGKDVM